MNHIPKELSKEDIENHFKLFGVMEEVEVIATKSKRFGYVKYNTVDAMKRALDSGTKLAGQDAVMIQVKGHMIECELEIAEKDDDDGDDDDTDEMDMDSQVLFLV